jgi:hypothetical protein
MSSSINFNNFIFPHISGKKQKKELSFMYCFHINISDFRNVQDSEYKKYLESMYKFVYLNMQNNLISPESNTKKYNKELYNALTRPENGNSSSFRINFVDPNEKRQLDNFLRRTNSNKNLDKFAYIYEGCQNDEKIFIGGKKDLVIYYCGLFPHVDYCSKLRKQTSLDLMDNRMKRVFDNPELADKIFDEVFKSLDLIDDSNKKNGNKEF